MTTVCTACGTENRDKARYCRGCARPLVPLSNEAAVDGATPKPRKSRSRSRSREAAPAAVQHAATDAPKKQGRVLAWLAGALLLAGLAAWQFWPHDTTLEAAAVPVAEEAPAPVPDQTPVAPDTLVAPAPASTRTTPASATPVVAQTSQPAAVSRPKPKPAPARPAKAVAAASAPAAPAASSVAPVVASPVATASTVRPEPAPARAMSVDESCADRSNFFTRDLCRIEACRNPALANDPVCVRFRKMEAGN